MRVCVGVCVYLLDVVQNLVSELLVHVFIDSLGNGPPHSLQL